MTARQAMKREPVTQTKTMYLCRMSSPSSTRLENSSLRRSRPSADTWWWALQCRASVLDAKENSAGCRSLMEATHFYLTFCAWESMPLKKDLNQYWRMKTFSRCSMTVGLLQTFCTISIVWILLTCLTHRLLTYSFIACTTTMTGPVIHRTSPAAS
ncbi:hypothetical protein DPMN_105790 [Dreissena polymorpha]|uniref:Uncharacterized protein n=1 Tax=Dreissena polymorpha TaxID=45954 RepID=A0A9D4QJ15_DREPO|nr:hypothetical protein DPMN_105790 [Dreissena polymorpha]